MSILYFAYGSNMDSQELEDRHIQFRNPQGGCLKDWELRFNKRSERRYKGCGVANIIPKEGSWVEGILYTIKPEDLSKLDKKEGYPEHYNREQLSIKLIPGGEVVSAEVYVAKPDKVQEELRPAREYMAHILAGRAWLSVEYIAKLETIEVSFLYHFKPQNI